MARPQLSALQFSELPKSDDHVQGDLPRLWRGFEVITYGRFWVITEAQRNFSSSRRAPRVPVLARDVEHRLTRALPPSPAQRRLNPRYTPPEMRSGHPIDGVADERGSLPDPSADRRRSNSAPYGGCSDDRRGRDSQCCLCHRVVGPPHALCDATVHYGLGADDNTRTDFQLA